MTTQLFTEIGNSYWNSNGIYQKEYNEYKNLVPRFGIATNINIELLRCFGNLYYEYNNNGNRNSLEVETEWTDVDCCSCSGSGVEYYDDEEVECENCCGSGVVQDEEETDRFIHDRFLSHLNYIADTIPETTEIIADIMLLILEPVCKFNAEEMNKYDKLGDIIIHYVINNYETT